MNTAAAVALLTSAITGGVFSVLYNTYKDFRDRRHRQQKQTGEVQIDSGTYNKIVAEAASINSDVAIAQQTWWQEQFNTVKDELVVEQRWRREMTRRILPAHEAWDKEVRAEVIRLGGSVRKPPPLEPDMTQATQPSMPVQKREGDDDTSA